MDTEHEEVSSSPLMGDVSGRRNQTSPSSTVQLYRPAGSCKQVIDFIARYDLSDAEIETFLAGNSLPPPPNVKDYNTGEDMKRKFDKRRREIHELGEKLHTGEAHIDDDGRLVVSEEPRPPNADLRPPPPPGRNENQRLAEPAGFVENLAQEIHDNNNNINDNQDPVPHLTFRRICFAILAVVLSFICVILQTLPLVEEEIKLDPNFDEMLHELLHVKFMKDHLKHCPNLDRDPLMTSSLSYQKLSLYHRLHSRIVKLFNFYSESSCDDGVLHIPPKHVIQQKLWHTSDPDTRRLALYQNGIDKIWNIPCSGQSNLVGGGRNISNCYPGVYSVEECPNSNVVSKTPNLCFRGIHDNFVSHEDVYNAIELGRSLISAGGDHFDIHYKPDMLNEVLPTLMEKMKGLLRERYNQTGLEPVAFRLQSVGAMDALGVDSNLDMFDYHALNVTNYFDWVQRSRRRNVRAHYSFPWPFRVKPARDECTLMADLEGDPRFAILTSISLSQGAGKEFRGGVDLFVDHIRSNYNLKQKIRHGMTIDASIGRVVVSSGGIENRRCRMPTRAGLKKTLQIWWDCAPHE